ncbi:MAG: TolC family protein [Candidatus Thermoplasmatota archaeon]|nr:TolC family protein [Candidatus Thermoplasmatota archaeon]
MICEVHHSATRSHIQKDVVWSRDAAARSQTQARIDALLAKPLSADDAVQIALLNNPGLQAAFNTLGIAEADWVAAQRLPNPGFSIGRLTRGSEVKWERSLQLNLARLLTMPMRADIEQRLFEQTRRALVLEVPRLAADTRKSWVAAVAAGQAAQYQQQAMDAAEAGAEVARRMAQVGNWSKLKQAREQAFYADAALAVARAGQVKLQARERLARLPGLPNADTLQLPDLPASLPWLPDVEQQAMDSRIDLQMTRLQTEALAKNLGLTRGTRFINVLELGVISNSSVVSLKQRISEENQLRYNGMLIGVFELLADARSQIASVNGVFTVTAIQAAP